jgi:hypothetical protein
VSNRLNNSKAYKTRTADLEAAAPSALAAPAPSAARMALRPRRPPPSAASSADGLAAAPPPTSSGADGLAAAPPPTSSGADGLSAAPPPTSSGADGLSAAPPPTSSGADCVNMASILFILFMVRADESSWSLGLFLSFFYAPAMHAQIKHALTISVSSFLVCLLLLLLRYTCVMCSRAEAPSQPVDETVIISTPLLRLWKMWRITSLYNEKGQAPTCGLRGHNSHASTAVRNAWQLSRW